MKFWQDGNNGTTEAPLPITKTLEHCTADASSMEVCVQLAAHETARFSDKTKAKVQFRAQIGDGAVIASREQLITVHPMNDEIIKDDITTPPANEEGWIILDGESIVS